MSILLSTNLYGLRQLKNALHYTDVFGSNIGFEILPLFHNVNYKEELKELVPEFQKTVISFHSPYYDAEYSAPKGTDVYCRTMKMVEDTLDFCRILNSRYMVFHHNNCKINEEKRDEMIKISCENYREIDEMFNAFNIPVVVENAGVINRDNMLFNQDEFIELCKKEGYKVLIDIGHAYANCWDIDYVVNSLKDQIVAYHLHNNDGVRDSHRRIHNGTLDFDSFINMAKNVTPDAEWILEYAPVCAGDIQGIEKDIKELLTLSNK